MAKLKYVDHSHENPIQAFFDFFNICFLSLDMLVSEALVSILIPIPFAM